MVFEPSFVSTILRFMKTKLTIVEKCCSLRIEKQRLNFYNIAQKESVSLKHGQ